MSDRPAGYMNQESEAILEAELTEYRDYWLNICIDSQPGERVANVRSQLLSQYKASCSDPSLCSGVSALAQLSLQEVEWHAVAEAMVSEFYPERSE